ncbi:hypothetical protein V8C26DRAFT_413117 [Trichoderma gracile]
MLTQVIDISYGSKERLQEILEEMLGEDNFKLVQVVVTFRFALQLALVDAVLLMHSAAHLEPMADQAHTTPNSRKIPTLFFYLIQCITILTCHKEEIGVIQTNMRRHYLPTA